MMEAAVAPSKHGDFRCLMCEKGGVHRCKRHNGCGIASFAEIAAAANT